MRFAAAARYDDHQDDHGGDGGEGGGAIGEDPPRPIWASDDAMAEILADQLTPNWRHVQKWEKWLRWDSQRWIEDDEHEINWLARMVCRNVAVRTDDTKPALRRAISSDRTINAGHAKRATICGCEPRKMSGIAIYV